MKKHLSISFLIGYLDYVECSYDDS